MTPDETPTPAPDGDKPPQEAAAAPETAPSQGVNDDPLFDPSERRAAPAAELIPEPKPDLPPPPPQQATAAPRPNPKQEFPDIPMPGAARVGGMRARDARINLDLDLGRIKRRKRYGLLITTMSVLFIAFVLAPVTWVGVYRAFDAPGTFLMMQRAAEGETIRHQPIPVRRMSPHIIRAVIAAEDSNFTDHEGFDWEAIQKALEKNAKKGKVVAGGSTISQQLAKNLFLSSKRTPWRKLEEALITIMLEKMMSKQRIFEIYLNVIEWGNGVFGAEAAARHYYRVSAGALSAEQAARLAAMIPNPRYYDKARNDRRLLRRTSVIARGMRYAELP